MRDLDRWKDKVELSLDGRQIFFLFFGSAVAACLVFVLGVLVGKRLEARALALTPAPVEDPLAALDQLGEADDADEGLTFHKALTKDATDLKFILVGGGFPLATALGVDAQAQQPKAVVTSPDRQTIFVVDEGKSSAATGLRGQLLRVSTAVQATDRTFQVR